MVTRKVVVPVEMVLVPVGVAVAAVAGDNESGDAEGAGQPLPVLVRDRPVPPLAASETASCPGQPLRVGVAPRRIRRSSLVL